MPKPTIYLIAGCNGAGKTTFAKEFLPSIGVVRFLNADEIARGLLVCRASAAADALQWTAAIAAQRSDRPTRNVRAESTPSPAGSLFAPLEQPRRLHPLRPLRERRRRTAPAQRLDFLE